MGDHEHYLHSLPGPVRARVSLGMEYSEAEETFWAFVQEMDVSFACRGWTDTFSVKYWNRQELSKLPKWLGKFADFFRTTFFEV